MARLAQFSKRKAPITARDLLASGLAGGFLLAFHLPSANAATANVAEGASSSAAPFAPNAFIRIDLPPWEDEGGGGGGGAAW